jgi:hypothetical protein
MNIRFQNAVFPSRCRFIRHAILSSDMRVFARKVLAIAVLSGCLGLAQNGQPIPRGPDGKPDLSGVWQSGGIRLDGESGLDRVPVPRRVNAAPMPEPLPYQSWAWAKARLFTPADDPIGRCLLPGVPRITSLPLPFEIVQTSPKVVIVYQAFHAFRSIPVDSQLRHPNDLPPAFMGDSVARWEGDTLLVDVTGFNDKTWLSGIGSFHSEDLHVVERFQLNTDDTLAYSATVNDPKVLTKPWTTGVLLRRLRNARVQEYQCLGNSQDAAPMPVTK